MRKVLLFIFLSASILSGKSQTSVKSVWTPAYEKAVYNNIDASIKNRMPDASRRAQLVTYVVNRLKEELPKGLKSVSDDSVYRLSVKIGAEYGYAHAQGNRNETGIIPSKRPWTPELATVLRQTMFRNEKKEDHALNAKLCDCVITKLKIIYPDSIMLPMPHDVIVKVTGECHDELIGNNK